MNDSMGKYVASEVVKLMLQRDIQVKGSDILILGITFKENCPDVRNTKAIDVILELESYGSNIIVYDPWASPQELLKEYGRSTTKKISNKKFDAIVLTVSHEEFLSLGIRKLLKKNGILYDVKGFLTEKVDGRL